MTHLLAEEVFKFHVSNEEGEKFRKWLKIHDDAQKSSLLSEIRGKVENYSNTTGYYWHDTEGNSLIPIKTLLKILDEMEKGPQ